MGNLRYRSGSVSKSYELKDSSAKPRLAIRTSSGTKYLTLKAGVRSGELGVRGASTNYYVKTWGQDIPEFWRGMDPEEPFRGMGANRDDSSHGGLGIWVLVNEENYPVVAFGRMGADRPDEWAKAIWYPNVAGTTSVTKWPANFCLTLDQVSHPQRLKPNIRLATLASNTWASKSALNSDQRNYYGTYNGDLQSTKNNIVINDIVTNLTTKSSYYGVVKYWGSYNTSAIYYTATSYGYGNLNTRGIHWPTGEEERFGVATSLVSGNMGIDSAGYKSTSYEYQLQSFYNGSKGISAMGYYTIYSGLTTSSNCGNNQVPYIQMYGVGDGNPGSSSYTWGNWAQRDFYIEFPYAWGEDTNPNDYFTFTPKQILNAVKAIAEAKGVADYNYGFARGRNY